MKYLSLTYIFLLFAGYAPDLIAQEIRPYLQSPSDTSIRITWKTDSDPESMVYYGPDSTHLSSAASGSCQVLSDAGYDGNYFYHDVHLTGLEPGQFYYYRAVTGTRQSRIYRFRTQPEQGDASGVFRFLVFGDHQVRGSDRYERLLVAAREKVQEKYGGTVEEYINLVINDGDQVDLGNLDQYEFVHFGPSSVLSGNVPIMTTVGNHETYGSLGLSAYYAHFFYDDLGYKGIASPGGENYYAYQLKNIVFIHLSSEHPDDSQVNWVRRIVDSVKTDPGVEWVISVAHRPIQAEQYVGDISPYVRDRIIPVLAETEKSALFISGHHHLYARGQVRDFPIYHIISGGGSWDQYWGQSTEKDFDDVQKTIDYWTYQIVTFDPAEGSMVVESYAIGGPRLGFTLDNILIDSFYRKFPAVPPDVPSLRAVEADSVALPYTFQSSPYSTGTGEPFNSVQFQIAPEKSFSDPAIDLIRDYENLYGTTGDPDYLPVDIHDTVDIFKYTLRQNALPDGHYFVRVRHRDRNITWSDWSAPDSFRVYGSAGGFPSISTPEQLYRPGEGITVHYYFGPGNATDWIGLYHINDTPGSVASTDWQYVSGTSGSVSLSTSQSGKFYIAFFENDGYQEIADRIPIYIVPEPELALSKAGYGVQEEIIIHYSNAPALAYDWLGVYKIHDVPGATPSTLWDYTSGTAGEVHFPEGLPEGYYYVNYFLDNGYAEAAGRLVFSVGSELAQVTTDKALYLQDEPVAISYENAPGLETDWIGIFRQNGLPGTAPLVTRKYVDLSTPGSLTFEAGLDTGQYYAALFIRDSNSRISNKAGFSVEAGASAVRLSAEEPVLEVYPVPSRGNFHLVLSRISDPGVTFSIVAPSGQLIHQSSTTTTAPEYAQDFDLSDRAPGIYLLTVSTGGHFFFRKLVMF